ncbi:hypothetical protein DMN91_010891 [Ooceraea biroi]|uniref:SAP domain-containing protein n=2 Tax=Ooceraea biroi TaxID=2015173 RepID=A0A3L8D9N6_OOCBI|nr:hypothetical protein DMN91_010891 [Ooceraea biroi]
MNPSRYKKVQLVELLKKRQLPTHGSKGEMIARLQEADPENLWMHEYESAEADGVARLDIGDQESSHVPQARVRQDNGVPDAVRELEYIRRERVLMEREMRLLERENQLLRSGSSTTSSGTSRVTEVPSRVNVKAVSELLSEFDGTEGTFRNWEKQAQLLISTYQLEDKYAKIMLGMRLKNKAPEWFHSCPAHIELSVE